ncbi:aldehyde dehydrogenase family protein [Streptomyces sp. CA-142005]|uniref:aldehyde dehydrogenase family protein n=1 Tax=Streptomyces sp. CA-142005 TaxID=3240052 RepID=UPI003D90DEF8
MAQLRAAHLSGLHRPTARRKDHLRRLRAMLVDQGPQFAEALHADLGKGPVEAHHTEIDYAIREIDYILAHLDDWLKPQSVQVPQQLGKAEAWTQLTPLGVVLVIAPWNYPLHLAVVPLAGALAAGNTVVVKPSELAPATSSLLARLLPGYLQPDTVAVVEGGPAQTTALLEQRFDHILYTGNGAVARTVMAAAARHLTPVTLELGGKSPVFVDRDSDVEQAASRLVAVKFINAGQACVAPDYVPTDRQTAPRLEDALAKAVHSAYSSDPALAPEYARIVNDRHYRRLVGLLASGRIVTGGDHDATTRFIAPTVLADVAPDAPVMQEEIFGPILPVLTVEDIDEAISFINSRPAPLGLYAFSNNPSTRERLLAETTSGAITFGLPMAQFIVPELPFGGVGESGLGSYHGRHSVVTFSHRRSVVAAQPSRPGSIGGNSRHIATPTARENFATKESRHSL